MYRKDLGEVPPSALIRKQVLGAHSYAMKVNIHECLVLRIVLDICTVQTFMSRAINMPNLLGFRSCSHSQANLICIYEIKKEASIILKPK